MQKPTQIETVSILILGTATALLTWFHKSFTRLYLGPIFVMEWALLIAVGLCFLKVPFSQIKDRTRDTLRALWPACLFFVLGAFRLLLDLPSINDFESKLARPFAIQYSLIWVYPLLWAGVGYFFHRHDNKAGRIWIVMIVLAQVIPGLWDERYHSVALGPIFLTVAWLYGAAHLDSSQRSRVLPWVVMFILTVAAVIPMWRMWYVNRASRTAFVIGICLLSALPILFSIFNRHFKLWVSLFISLLIATVWVGGTLSYRPFSAITHSLSAHFETKTNAVLNASTDPSVSNTNNPAPVVTAKSVKPALKEKFLDVMQHSEDKPVSEDESVGLQGRTRKVMWKMSLMQWRLQPVMGVGFTRFVPLIRGPGIINDVARAGHLDQYRPVNGTHNSYLTILARMGIVGMVSFAVLFVFLIRESFRAIARPLDFSKLERLTLDDFFSPLLVSGLLGGAIYAAFNVGFESPQNGLLFWFFAGILVAENLNKTTASTDKPKV